MSNRENEKHVLNVLKSNGAENIKGYTLVNNWGFTFEVSGVKYDARFWANCYGVAWNAWDCGAVNGKADTELTKKICRELNI